MIQNINIVTPNTTNTYFVKTPIPEITGWDKITESSTFQGSICVDGYIYNGYIYIFTCNIYTNVLQLWKSNNGENWSEVLTDIPTDRSDFRIAELNGIFYLMGGYNNTYRSDVWSSSDGETWTQLTSDGGFGALGKYGCCVHDGYIYIAGGKDGAFENSNKVWKSNDGENWSLVTDSVNNILITKGYTALLYSFNQNLYIMCDGLLLKSINDGVNWTSLGSEDVAQYSGWSPSPIQFGDKLYKIGGYNLGFENKVWSSSDGETWTYEENEIAERQSNILIVYNDNLYVIGGVNVDGGYNPISDVWVSILNDEYDYTQCPITEATGMAVLRYIPTEAEIVAGEVYSNNNPLTKFKPHTIDFSAVGITNVNLYVKLHTDTEWLLYGKNLPTISGHLEYTLLLSDFSVGDVIDLKLKDVDTDISAIAESLEILPSFTLDVYPVGAKALESAQTFSGTAQTDRELTITLSSTTGSKVVTTTPVLGEWSEDIALTTDEDGFEPDDNVNVEIVRTTYDSKDYGELYSVTGNLAIDDSVEPFVTGTQALDTAFDVVVDSNLEGKTLTVKAKRSGEAWVDAVTIGTGVVSGGTVAVSCTLLSTDFDSSDTVNIKAVYGTVESDVVELVAESITTLLSMTATCIADAPEDTTELIGTLTIDVSCTADTPTDI